MDIGELINNPVQALARAMCRPVGNLSLKRFKSIVIPRIRGDR